MFVCFPTSVLRQGSDSFFPFIKALQVPCWLFLLFCFQCFFLHWCRFDYRAAGLISALVSICAQNTKCMQVMIIIMIRYWNVFEQITIPINSKSFHWTSLFLYIYTYIHTHNFKFPWIWYLSTICHFRCFESLS